MTIAFLLLAALQDPVRAHQGLPEEHQAAMAEE
jgi:hypothetical protein